MMKPNFQNKSLVDSLEKSLKEIKTQLDGRLEELKESANNKQMVLVDKFMKDAFAGKTVDYQKLIIKYNELANTD